MSSDEKKALEESSVRAYHYMQWLTKEKNFILTDVEMKVVATEADEPLVSCVRKDVIKLINESRSSSFPENML